MGITKKSGIYDIKIVKHGRKWTQIEYSLANKNSWRKSRVNLADVSNVPEGSKITVSGCVEIDSNRYGVKTTFYILSDETMKEIKIEELSNSLLEGISRGKIYKETLNKLHSLGCYVYDSQIENLKMQQEAEYNKDKIRRWWGYFCSNFDNGNGYIYERAIRELHSLGCYDYDNDIEEARQKLLEKRAEKRQKELEKGLVKLALPADGLGYARKPKLGELFMHKGVPYKVKSSYYNKEDGRSFGVNSESWYQVWAYNIENSEQGKEMISAEKERIAELQYEREKKESFENLVKGIKEKGSQYKGKTSLIELEENGKVIYSNMNIYGGGYEIIIIKDKVWLVCNNGSDGGLWSINNISTGGGGAYGYIVNITEIKDRLENFYKYNK